MSLNQMYYRVSLIFGGLMALVALAWVAPKSYQAEGVRPVLLMGGLSVIGLMLLAKGLKKALARPWAVRCPFAAALLVVVAYSYVIALSFLVGSVLYMPAGDLLHAPLLLLVPFGLFLYASSLSFPIFFGLWMGLGILFYALKRRHQEAI
jgi:hypothetical protein